MPGRTRVDSCSYEHCVVVHRMTPIMDGSCRRRWHLIYLDAEGKETHDPGAKASQERIDASVIIDIVTIARDGVLGHAVTRKLGRAHWKFDEAGL